jgi:cytochrome c-type biogenesis protein CcmH/NrfG
MTRSRFLIVAFALSSLFSLNTFAEEKKPARSAQELAAFGKNMLEAGHPEAAIAFLEEAVAMQPAFADAYELLGDAYAFSGRNDKAVRAYEKFLALAPLDPRAGDVSKFVQDHRPAPANKSPGKSG